MFCDIGKFKKYVGKKFLILSQADERFAIDSSNNQKDGGEIILWEANKGNKNQIWTVDCMGHLMLADAQSSVLYAKDTVDSTKICVTGANENGFQPWDALARWTLTKAGEILSQVNPGQMFNVCGGKCANKATMIMWHKQGPEAKNDKWKIEVVGGFEAKKETYEIGGFKGFVDQRFYIRCQGDEKFVVDSASKQRGAGGDSLLWSDTKNKNPNQIWTVDKDGHIINAENPGNMMALVPVKCAQGAKIAVCKLTPSGLMNAAIARWSLNEAGEVVNMGNPNLVLNICGGAIKDGPALILWPRQKTSAKNDKWRLDKA